MRIMRGLFIGVAFLSSVSFANPENEMSKGRFAIGGLYHMDFSGPVKKITWTSAGELFKILDISKDGLNVNHAYLSVNQVSNTIVTNVKSRTITQKYIGVNAQTGSGMTTSSFDESGCLTSELITSHDFTSSEQRKCDKLGHTLYIKVIMGIPMRHQSVYEYFYKWNPSFSKVTISSTMGGEFDNGKFDVSFNKFGHPVSIQETNSYTSKISTITYAYDSHGNWTSRLVEEKDSATGKVSRSKDVRVIEYWK